MGSPWSGQGDQRTVPGKELSRELATSNCKQIAIESLIMESGLNDNVQLDYMWVWFPVLALPVSVVSCSCLCGQDSVCLVPTAMPNHPYPTQRQPCGAILLKTVKTKRSCKLVPMKTYPYCSLKKSIRRLISQKGFLQKCEQWRNRSQKIPPETLGDVYDGEVWKMFHDRDYNDFLNYPYSYLLSLNVDWFQPFVHTIYSTGAIYLTIQNIPRLERYKTNNIILVGVMPGPKEPKLTANSYLAPLVNELQEFYDGVVMPVMVNNKEIKIRIRLALSCVACDIPASRIVSGFLGHNARLGCNKCLREFHAISVGEQKLDFSGYNRDQWTLRTVDNHRHQCRELLTKNTHTSLQEAESKYGVRYSILISLPYFNPIQFTVIDPMHNLFLCTGKHVFKIWVQKEYISKSQLYNIETRLKLFRVPSDIGRLPSNNSTGYGGFTANQWSNWITIFSAAVLKGILPEEHLRCWLLFVRACSILKSRVIRKQDVLSADLFFLQFCRTFETLYGKDCCTPNMHLHTHLKQSILDFGPLHSFWCYAFERYNGILGSVPTNQKSIESQLMRRFCREQNLCDLELPDNIATLLPSTATRASSILDRDDDTAVNTYFVMSRSKLSDISSFAVHQNIVKGLPPFSESVLSAENLTQLNSVYTQLYPNKVIKHVPAFIKVCGRVILAGDIIGSTKPGPNNISSSVVMAFWPGRGNSLQSIDYCSIRVGIVNFYFEHTVVFDQSKETHVFCFVEWKKVHPHSNWCGISASVCSDLF